MPRPRSGAVLPKKHVLSLAQIASYDDILTDAVVDHTFYWTMIPKNRPSYLPSRGVKEGEITQIIQTCLIVNPDIDLAERKLLETNGLAKFYRTLKTDNEKEDFRRHLRRYMNIYLPDCPFEVASTNRYTIFQEEACIMARRFIKSHETIKYLSGIQVVITPEEEAQLSARKKDFSIVVSSRKKEVNLFMGPARFANHDCDANARLVTTGQSGIEIIATKPIAVGDEITVTYGDSYFGEDNCECLCKTCEDRLVNGWAPAVGTSPVKQSVEDYASGTQGYSLRKREDSAMSRGHSETPSLTPIARPKVRKTKLRYLARTAESTPTIEVKPVISTARTRKRGADILATPPVTPAKRRRAMTPTESDVSTPLALDLSTRENSDSNNVIGANTDDPMDADVEAVLLVQFPDPDRDDEQEMHRGEVACEQMPSPQSSQQGPDDCDLKIAAADGDATLDSMMISGLPLPTPELSGESEEDERSVVRSKVAALEGGSALPITPRRHAERSESVKDESDLDSNCGTISTSENEERIASNVRVPGDYTLTPLLLSEPETAWVFCTVCSKAFVQRDAYFTKMACPRCERHSKLYGYMWPKTEPEGKHDKEERILDHRLVHRFLGSSEEAKTRGRKSISEMADDAERSGTNRRRASSATTNNRPSLGSGIWRKLKYMTDATQKTEKKPPRVASKVASATSKAMSSRPCKAAESINVNPISSKSKTTNTRGSRATSTSRKAAAVPKSKGRPRSTMTAKGTRTAKAAKEAKGTKGISATAARGTKIEKVVVSAKGLRRGRYARRPSAKRADSSQ